MKRADLRAEKIIRLVVLQQRGTENGYKEGATASGSDYIAQDQAYRWNRAEDTK